MHNIENIPGLLSVVNEKKEIAEMAHEKWLESVKRVDNAVRNEWRNNLEDLKNKDYLLVNPVYFGTQNCLVPRKTGDNFKYMRFIEDYGNGYELSKDFPFAFHFKGSQLKGLFGSIEKFEEYTKGVQVFADFMKDENQYLVLISYTKCGIDFDLFKNLSEFVVIKI